MAETQFTKDLDESCFLETKSQSLLESKSGENLVHYSTFGKALLRLALKSTSKCAL